MPTTIALEMSLQKFRCSECPAEYIKMGSFKKHLERHRAKPYLCKSCSAGFKFKSNLILHDALHCVSDPTCPECSKKFSRLSSLKAHLMFHEKNEDSDELNLSDSNDEENEDGSEEESDDDEIKRLNANLFCCKHCPLKFVNQYLLQQHKEVHKKVEVPLSVKEHKHKNTVIDAKYKCKYCGKAFQKLSMLGRHILIHTGERPFKCDLCDKAFNQRIALDVHKKSLHSVEHPHVCNFCSRTFAQEENLSRHVSSAHAHSGEFGSEDQHLYTCSHCNCSFKKSSSLNNHVLSAHTNYLNKGSQPRKSNFYSDKVESGSESEESFVQVKSEIFPDKPEGQVKESVVVTEKLEKESVVVPKKLEMQVKVVLEKADITVDSGYSENCSSLQEPSITNKSTSADDSSESDSSSMDTESKFGTVMKSMPERYKVLAGKNSHAFDKYIFRKDDGVNFYGCKHCFKEYKSLRTLATHICSSIPKEPAFKCPHCSGVFSCKRDLVCHTKIHVKRNNEIRCYVCDKSFLDWDTLKIHRYIHPESKTYKCSLCNEMFYTSKHRRNHMIQQCRTSPPKTLSKNTMAASSSSPFKESSVIFDINLVQSPPVNLVVCPDIVLTPDGSACKKEFSGPNDSEVDPTEAPLNCLWCNKAFASNGAYRIHLEAHASVKRFRCQLCDSVFFTETLLKEHISYHVVP